MKAASTTFDMDNQKKIISEILFSPNDSSEPQLVFIDTNILIWLYRLDSESFNELTKLFYSLSYNNQLIIPKWVIHEYNKHIINYEENVFYPYKQSLKSLEKNIKHLEEIGRLVVDNNFAKKNGFENKKEFIDMIKEDIDKISSKIRLLTNKNNYQNNDRRIYIEELIEANSSKVNINEIISRTSSYEFRYSHLIPPGFEDNNKLENKYGDLIIWKEILENCIKYNSKNILFISLDTKKDWAYSPLKIILKGKNVDNSNRAIKYYSILPWLENEFKEIVKGERIIISNMHLLTRVLFSQEYNCDYANYKNIAKAIDVELEKSDTNKVIQWLFENDETVSLLIHSVCKWEHTPEEINSDSLKKWFEKNIKLDCDYNNVNWGNVIVEIFI